MHNVSKALVTKSSENPVKLKIVDPDRWEEILAGMSPMLQRWVSSQNFPMSSGAYLLCPADEKGESSSYVILKSSDDGFSLARLCWDFPDRLCEFIPDERGLPANLGLAWGLEAYQFDRYKAAHKKPARLLCPTDTDFSELVTIVESVAMVRDMINTPANDFGPDELQKTTEDLGLKFSAEVNIVTGDKLKREFPLIHAVGQASPRLPRLIDLQWGNAENPKVTLVGKGVCFDTGGLDIKPKSGMGLMKKDMGGAANVLGLAQMIMAAGLAVRLRVLIPAVENSIAGQAMRPGDVYTSRKGLTVEIDNTDAEGRLVLADALALADDERPELLIDMATLTGAARVALGPDLPPFFTDDEVLSKDIQRQALAVKDPVWRLPLWTPYNNLFSSSIADMSNSSDSSFAGAIQAALFLKRFVEHSQHYVHFDVYGWQPQSRPGSPRGGEAQAIRLLYSLIKERFHK